MSPTLTLRSTPAAGPSSARPTKPTRARLNAFTLSHHRPTADDTPIPMRLRSSSLIRSPESPFHRRSVSPSLSHAALP